MITIKFKDGFTINVEGNIIASNKNYFILSKDDRMVGSYSWSGVESVEME